MFIQIVLKIDPYFSKKINKRLAIHSLKNHTKNYYHQKDVLFFH